MESALDWILKGALILVALLMTFFILLQEGKGGGLAALGGTKAAGVEGVTNPIRRATGYLAGLFFLLAIALGILSRGGSSENEGLFDKDKGALRSTAPKEKDRKDQALSPKGKPDGSAPAQPGPGKGVKPAAKTGKKTTPKAKTKPQEKTQPDGKDKGTEKKASKTNEQKTGKQAAAKTEK